MFFNRLPQYIISILFWYHDRFDRLLFYFFPMNYTLPAINRCLPLVGTFVANVFFQIRIVNLYGIRSWKKFSSYLVFVLDLRNII